MFAMSVSKPEITCKLEIKNTIEICGFDTPFRGTQPAGLLGILRVEEDGMVMTCFMLYALPIF
jgi:hypothetical protein